MKRILLGIVGVMGIMGYWACDKIASDEYTVYDGAVFQWSGGEGAPAVQRAYVEKYTGPHCINCPLADETLDDAHNTYGEKLVLVSINHYDDEQGAPYPNQPDMRTIAGNTWAKYFGINALPAAYLNRDRSKQYTSSMSDIKNAIGSAIGASCKVGIRDSAAISGGKVTLTVDLQFYQKIEEELTVTAAVIEDSLAYKQSTPTNGVVPDYRHNHMLRDVVTGYWGCDLEADGTVGEKVHGSLDFTLPEGCVQQNCKVVVFVSEKKSRKVLNSAECHIN